jgi:hypothetical protein
MTSFILLLKRVGETHCTRDYLDVGVDFCVEENQQSKWDDPDGDEPEPVEVDGVVGVRPQLRRLQDGE